LNSYPAVLSPLFPYTTLFRSAIAAVNSNLGVAFQSFDGVTKDGPRDIDPRGHLFLSNLDHRNIRIRLDAQRFGLARTRMLSFPTDRKSTRLNSSHEWISYAVF